MPKFRKKPVEVEAIRWTGGYYESVVLFCGQNWGRADACGIKWQPEPDGEFVVVYNAIDQQWLCVPVGFWIVRGIKGELYPCEDEIFQATYDAVPDPGTMTCPVCIGKGTLYFAYDKSSKVCTACVGTGRATLKLEG